jgi:tight adherence protein B
MIASAVAACAVVIAGLALRPRRRRGGSPAMQGGARPIDLLATWRHRRAGRLEPDARAVASWCDDIGRQVRSGSTLRDSMSKAPSDPVMSRSTAAIRLALDRGLSIPDAIARIDDAGPHLRLALGVLATTSRLGGPTAASIDRTAVVLRQRAADLDERSAQAASARLSTHVMTAVPLAMLAVLTATDDDVRAVTVAPVGAACIASGLILNALGWWWMRRIVRSST